MRKGEMEKLTRLPLNMFCELLDDFIASSGLGERSAGNDLMGIDDGLHFCSSFVSLR